jgi:hypothetical protein
LIEGDNEKWLLDVANDIIEKKAALGYASLDPLERLTYCLWVADYGMRNGGDLATASDLHLSFITDARSAAVELGLPHSVTAFSLSAIELERRYFALFDDLCQEIRAA